MNAVAIFLGGGLGALARYGASHFLAARFGETFPLGTLFVNVLGCLAIGWFAGLTGPDGRWLVPPVARQFVTIGFLGGFTTFSSFSLQTLELTKESEWGGAGLNCLLNIALCLGATWIGMQGAVWWNSGR
jgi:CrcB protein